MGQQPFFIKQGAALSVPLQLLQDDGSPVNITGATLFSEIRDAFDTLVATPTLTVTNAALGQFVYAATSNAEWPIGQLKSDIYAMLASGVPFYSETFFIIVAAAVTNPGDQG